MHEGLEKKLFKPAFVPSSIIYVVQTFSGINSGNMSELKMSKLMPEF